MANFEFINRDIRFIGENVIPVVKYSSDLNFEEYSTILDATNIVREELLPELGCDPRECSTIECHMVTDAKTKTWVAIIVDRHNYIKNIV